MTPYDYVRELADLMEHDGLGDEAKALRDAHQGIFNNTELFFAWRFAVAFFQAA